MRPTRLPTIALATAVTAIGAAPAAAATMHPRLAARLSGMGADGAVDLHVAKHRLCWTFDLMGAKGLTRATIRDRGGMIVARLGKRYMHKGCAMVPEQALARLESHPGRYRVEVDAKGHPGELRGRLVPGMAHGGM